MVHTYLCLRSAATAARGGTREVSAQHTTHVNMYIRVWMCIHVYIYIYVHLYAHMVVPTYTHIYICTLVCVCICKIIYAYIYSPTYTHGSTRTITGNTEPTCGDRHVCGCAYTHIYIRLPVCTWQYEGDYVRHRTHVYTCTLVWMCIYIFIYVCHPRYNYITVT